MFCATADVALIVEELIWGRVMPEAKFPSPPSFIFWIASTNYLQHSVRSYCDGSKLTHHSSKNTHSSQTNKESPSKSVKWNRLRSMPVYQRIRFQEQQQNPSQTDEVYYNKSRQRRIQSRKNKNGRLQLRRNRNYCYNNNEWYECEQYWSRFIRMYWMTTTIFEWWNLE